MTQPIWNSVVATTLELIYRYIGLPSACTVFIFFIFFFILFLSLFIHLLIVVLLYFYLLSNTTNRLTWWAMKSIKVTRRWIGENVMVRRLEGRRAKVDGTCVIADGKFQPSGISGDLSVTFPVTSPDMPNGWNFPSAITHVLPTFARLPSHLRTVTES